MVFTTTTLFKSIACPEGKRCKLTNCIYAHDENTNALPAVAQTIPVSAGANQLPLPTEPAEPATKRRKITYETLADKPPSRADLIRNQLATTRSNLTSVRQDHEHAPKTSSSGQPPLASLVRPVSPPPTRANKTAAGVGIDSATNSKDPNTESSVTAPKDEKVESLNPRLIANDPAGHQKRSLYLKHLHAEMSRLNQMAKETMGLEPGLLFLTEQALIRLALDEEEKYARDQPKVYTNVVKQRIGTYKKMQGPDWLKHVKATIPKDKPKPPTKKSEEKTIDTGLPLEHEHLILTQLVADQAPLAAFGYIPKPPSVEEAAEAAAAVEASKNWEVCDRCSGRFQVFPDRNEEGRLASQGPCFFHPYRKVFPPRLKSDKETGAKDPYYPCCNEKVGAPGCTRHEDHVFKTGSPARLAAIMPFVTTPENPSPSKDRRGKEVNAVTFDCEMGYTAMGMELIRLTAVSWPSGDPLLDILVRPLGSVIDFNSRFSGVTHESFKTAIPYDEWESHWQSKLPPPPSHASGVLPIVDNPQRARELLCSFIKPTTPLIGHAIDNDLNTVRLCHPTIVDTIVLYPHPRGLPMRFGLKMLTQRHLNRYIQTGGDRGHDSLEDAVATGDLVRIKVGEKWRMLKSSGWQIIDKQLVPPASVKSADAQSEERWAALADRAAFGPSTNKKRKKRPSTDGSDDASDEGGNSDDAKAADTTTVGSVV